MPAVVKTENDMQEESTGPIHEFTQAVTRLVVDKDGIEATPTPDIEATLLAGCWCESAPPPGE
jgi:hypothetical protein